MVANKRLNEMVIKKSYIVMKPTALITGASRGVGLQIAVIMAAKNMNLVLVARSEDALNSIKTMLENQYGVDVHIIVKDLTEKNATYDIFKQVEDKNIEIDYLINNAGFGEYGYFESGDWGRFRQMIELNIMALTHLCHLFLPQMLKRNRGRILNVASTAAFQPGPMMAVYFASKAYVLHFSEAIRNEVKNRGVSVTALCPGPTRTDFMEDSNFKISKMVNGKPLSDAHQVAVAGYHAMMRGKPFVIHGWRNKIIAESVRFVPRSWATYITRKLMERSQ